MGRPPRRRPRQLRDAGSRSAMGSHTSSGCSRSSPRWSHTTSTRATCRRRMHSSATGAERVGVQHHHAHLAACLAEHGVTRAGDRRDLRRHGLRARRHACGAASCCTATCAASSGSGTCIRCACRAASRRSASRGAWPARGWWSAGRAPGVPAALAASVEPRRGRPWPSWHAAGSRRRSRRARGGCSTRSRRCAGCARASTTKARPRPSSRRSPRRRAGLLSPALPVRRARCPRDRARRWRGTLPRACPPRSCRPASTMRSHRPRRTRAPKRPSSTRPRRSCCRAACSRTRCCWSAPPPRSAERGLRVLVPLRLPPNDGGISYGQAAVAASLTGA